MAMSGSSAINITVRIAAKEALAMLAKMKIDLNKVEIQATDTGAALELVKGAARSMGRVLTNSSKAAADLAKALSLANSAAGKFQKNLLDVGAAGELAAPAIIATTRASQGLAAVVGPLSVQLALMANSLKMIAAASRVSAAEQARADAIRTRSAQKAAEQASLASIREKTARDRSAAAAVVAANKIAQSNSRTVASEAKMAASVEAAEARATAARERAAAAAAAAAAATARASAMSAAGAGAGALAGAGAGAGIGAAAAGAGAASTAVGRLTERVNESGAAMRRAGSQSQWMGRQISTFFTVPFALAAGAAVKWGNDQEKAFTMAKKVYGDGTEAQLKEIDRLRGGFDALSVMYGRDRVEVYETAEAWASLGITGGNLGKSVQTATQLAAIGNMDLEEATTSLIAVQAQYQLSTTELTTAMMQMNAIANNGPTEIGPLSEAMRRVGASAYASGMSVAETAAIIEQIAPSAGTATQAGNGLKSMLVSLLSPTADAADAIDHFLGTGTVEKWKANGVGVTDQLKEMGEAYKFMTPQQKIAFDDMIAGRYQLSRFGQTLVGMNDPLSYYSKSLAAVAGDQVDANGALLEGSDSLRIYNSEMKILMDSDPMKFSQALQAIKGSLVDAFKPIVPTLMNVVFTIAKLFRAFANLPEPVKKFAIFFGLATALIGPFIMIGASLMILLGAIGPALMWVAGAVMTMGNAFIWMASSGALGSTPALVTRVTGLFATMAAGVGTATGFMSTIWGAFWVTSGRVAAGGAAANSGIIQVFLARIATAYVSFSTWASSTWLATWLGQIRTSIMGSATQAGIFTRMFTALAGFYATALTRLSSFWALFWVTSGRVAAGGAAANSGIIQRMLAGMATMYVAMLPRVLGFWSIFWVTSGRVAAGGAAANSGLIQRMLAGMATMYVGFTTTVGGLWTGFVTMMTASTAILGLPVWAVIAIIAAVAAAALAIYHFRDDIGKAFKAIPGIFKAAGNAIAQVIMAIWRFLVNAAKKIRQAISDGFNPFQRHSPSLVDNVQAGMAIVKDEYASAASSVEADMARARAAVEAFGQTSVGLTGRADEIKFQDNRAKIAQVDPAAAVQYDGLRAEQGIAKRNLDLVTAAVSRQQSVVDSWQNKVDAADEEIKQLNRTLDALQKQVDATSDTLDKAKERLAEYSNAQIEGQGAASDAAFENEMAQKRLRLEIMKLEETGGAIDSIADKYSKLQGEIENLSGQRNDLRQAGAGSDILATYDRMIADLEAQQGALATGTVSPIQAAQKELERLQAEAERMDLENSLKFDPMTRQIEKMTSAMKELPFDQITAGITREKAAVEAATIAHDAAVANYEAQKGVVDAATSARDQLNYQLEDERAKLDQLTEAQGRVQQSYDDITSAMDVAVGAADTIIQKEEELAQAAKEASEALDGAGDSVSDVGEKLGALGDEDFSEVLPGADELGADQWAKDLEEEMNKAFGEISLNPFAGMGEKMKTWWQNGGARTLFGDTMGGELEKAFKEGTGGIDWGRLLFGDLSQGDKMMKALFGEDIGGQLGRIFQEGTGGVDWGHLIFGDASTWPSKFTQYGRDIINGLGNGITEILADPFQWIRDHIPLVDTFARAFGIESPSTVFHGFGTNIMEGLYNGLLEKVGSVLTWFTELPGRVFTAIGDLDAKVSEKFSGAMNWVRDHLPGWAQGVWDWFAGTPQQALTSIGDLAGKVGEKFSGALSWVRDQLPAWAQGIWDWFAGLPQRVVDAIGNFKDRFVQIGKDIVQGMIDGVGSMGSVISDYIGGFFKRNVVDKVTGVFDSHSPSRVFMGIGGDVGDGLVIGINDKAGDIAAAAQGMADQVASVKMPDLAAPTLAAQTTAVAPISAPILPPMSGGTPDAVVGETTKAATTLMSTYSETTEAQLSGVSSDYAMSYQGIHDSTLATLTDLSTQEQLLQATKQTALINAQNGFSATTTASNNALHDVTIAIQTDLSAQILAVQTAMMNNSIATMTSTRDQLTNLSANTRDMVTSNFQSLATNLANIMGSSIRPTLNEFGPLMDFVVGTFATGVNSIGANWDRVREATAAPVRFTITQVFNDGIVGMWNSMNGLLGTAPLSPYPLRFAEGGPVPLNLGERGKDSIPAMLMPGEFVFKRAAVARLGADNLSKVNNGSDAQGLFGPKFNRDDVPHFASGGLVPGGAAFEALKKGHDWARSRNGRPYVLGGSADGSGGTDCSGFMSGIADVIMGGNGRRQWATMSFNGGGNAQYPSGPQGFVAGLGAGFSVGVKNGGSAGGHTAGTLGGVPGLPTVNVESGGSHGNVAYGGPAAGADHSQFPTQYHMQIVNDAFMSAGAGGGSGPSMSDMVQAIRGPAWEKIMNTANSFKAQQAGMFGEFPSKFAQAVRTPMDALIDKKLSEMNTDPGGTDVERWRPMAKNAMSRVGRGLRPEDAVQVDAMMKQIGSESGGNPGIAQQIVDVNGTGDAAGVGLLQIIPTTWAANRDPALPDDRRDPFANMVGALRYYTGRYGSDLTRMWGHGHGYDMGGVLPTGISQAINASGKPEAILTATQWKNISSLATGMGTFINLAAARIGKTINTIASSIGKVLNGIFRGKPIPVKPTTPPVVVPPIPPVVVPPKPTTPPVPTLPAGADAFWSSASAQMKTWTADLTPAIEGVEGVVANLPRVMNEVVVPEWPTMFPEIPKVVIPKDAIPEIPLGTGAASGGTKTPTTPTTPVVTVPVVTTPTTPTTGTGSSSSLSNAQKLVTELGNQGKTLWPLIQKAGSAIGPVLSDAFRTFGQNPAGAIKSVIGAFQTQAQNLAPAVTAAGQALAPLLGPAISDVVKTYGPGGTGVGSLTTAVGDAQMIIGTSNGTITASLKNASGTVSGSATIAPQGDTTTININGNLEFSGITNANDVDSFLSQLKARAGGSA